MTEVQAQAVSEATYMTKQITERFGISRVTLFNWEKKGIITPKRDYRGWRKFTEKDCENILRLTTASSRSYGEYRQLLTNLTEKTDGQLNEIQEPIATEEISE